ncbi:hypothetical protein B7R77_20945 [Ralstonia solanacearum K60]|uniref:Pvc16 N-terminal domain-containing protein n=1 Tax=Ralstonia solanacearum K60 TaxID=1091042 RepID=A0AAP7ZHW6_RALSL|nr:hypothetical protein B7R77_20945 [Ralstonia solanacearum K60]RIJ84686.1 DUF4255 domain-containing protein [Ralstonia solanacearum]
MPPSTRSPTSRHVSAARWPGSSNWSSRRWGCRTPAACASRTPIETHHERVLRIPGNRSVVERRTQAGGVAPHPEPRPSRREGPGRSLSQSAGRERPVDGVRRAQLRTREQANAISGPSGEQLVIDYLDTLLHRLFRNSVAELTADGQIRFQPPDEDWRALVPTITDGAGNPANSLNVYLVDLRENRKLRTNERERMVQGSDVFEVPPPRRVDCHYLVSAWSPAVPGPAIDPTLDEHALLAETARVLGAHDELDPVAIYALSNPPQLPPPPIANERFPLTLLPVEGFPKYAEFWGTMGDKNRWKPCIYTVITVALKEQPLPVGPMVTTTFTRTLVRDNPATENTRFHIGGIVYDNAVPPLPVALAWVELLTPANQRIAFTRADALGRFVFADVVAGAWQVRASAMPQGVSPPRAITVPEPTGNYDISF